MKQGHILIIGVLGLGLALVLAVSLIFWSDAAVGAQADGPTGELMPGEALAPEAPLGTAFTYQGRLTEDGNLAQGTYDFRFTLYDAASAGTQVGSVVTKSGITVTDGLFTVELDFGSGVFTGEARYLEIAVRPGATVAPFTTLSPRQALTSAPYALGLRPGAQVISEEAGSDAIRGEITTSSGTGVVGEASATTGNTFGIRGINSSSGGIGVYGWAGSATSGSDGRPYGVSGYSKSGHGVFGETLGDWSNISGVYGLAVMDHANGVNGVNSAGGYGVRAESYTGVALAAKSRSSNIIEAWDIDPSEDRRWYVRNDGEVYADGSFHSSGADFVEILPATGELEPGDVLVIGPDGLLRQCSSPYAATVAGIYSTRPGFVGGSDEELENAGKVPLAVVGVVPVKASAENGPIAPGDLLTTSSIPGHAMRADHFVGGTIIGKALESLDQGTGTVLALVTLQ
jgi:hypothetical protein